MGDPLDTSDFLTRALRESRTSVADDGFTARVAERAQAERRQAKYRRALPALMALFGLAFAWLLNGFAGWQTGMEQVFGALDFPKLSDRANEALSRLALYGLQPWMVLATVAVVLYALFSGEPERRDAFRF